MSELWITGAHWVQASGGGATPEPVPVGDPTVTWDVNFVTSPSQWTYARGSLSSYFCTGEGAAGVGIVAWTTKDANGFVLPHFGFFDPNSDEGLEDSISDFGVIGVTFGWYIYSGGSDACVADMTMEVWVG